MDPKIIGILIKEDRHRKKMTLKEYARELGISIPYLSDIERGRRLLLPELEHANRVLQESGYRITIKVEHIDNVRGTQS